MSNYTTPGTSAHGGPTPYETDYEKKSKMIRKMLFIGYEMGYDQPRTPAQEKGMDKKQRCWANVQAWCKSKHCSINKELKRYTVEELVQVLTQFEQVRKSFVDQYNKAG